MLEKQKETLAEAVEHLECAISSNEAVDSPEAGTRILLDGIARALHKVLKASQA